MTSQTHRFEAFVVCSALADSLTLQRHHRQPVVVDPRPEVVVGVDGLPGALKAVTWGAVEAELRCVPLRLVYAVDPSDAATTGTGRLPAGPHDTALIAAAERARRASRSIDVVAEIDYATASVALARDSAVMICVGSNGPRPPHPGHRVGTATEVLLDADCPVTIVRGDPLADGWIVARLGSDPAATDLLRVAVDEAVLRRKPLRLLTHWTRREGATDPAELDTRLTREIDARVGRHPGLDVAVEPGVELESYLRARVGQIALFIAADRQSHDIGTVLDPAAECALGVLPCSVMLHAGATPR
ncbi:universal stress protein [Mycobacterium antarcticum]|uniref:universal stress protein n=1 Tax=Mycolicibacterium sp. TUM20985 TaxID=3023370 RepID=UPI002572C77B|nr:universal stress protein [Mycolicibacterium sp. TUM20985]BDX33613.1 universal stress protein [Mycolicibacterium sp. TUM20985]